MNSFVQLLAFGAGAFCLGVSLTLMMIFAQVSRHSSGDSDKGYFIFFLSLIPLGFAVYFFFVAIKS